MTGYFFSSRECHTNAIILAAGKSSKFFPPLYDLPKGLFEFRGEVLIERQIRQLREAGVCDITVVVGYEKERFFYLDTWEGVDLVVSPRYVDGGSMSSLELVRDRLGGSFLCAADHWYDSNPFLGLPPSRSTRLIEWKNNAWGEFVADVAPDGRITSVCKGAGSGLCMVGWSYVTEDAVDELFRAYDAEHGRLGVGSMHWEEFWGLHLHDVPLWAAEAPPGTREFDSLSELREADPSALENINRAAARNLCRLLKCGEGEVSGVEPLGKGLTNSSFSFFVRDERYVYRQPGPSSGNMVDRAAEVHAQREASRLGIDGTVLAIDEEGWKLSRYVEAGREFSYGNVGDLSAGMAQLRLLHDKGAACEKEVDLLSDGDRLQRLASAKKEGLAERFAGERRALERLWHHVGLDDVPKVLCHNDAYAPNWIVGVDGTYHLIDWEYAGMNDPYNDIATLTVRDGLSREADEEVLRLFVGHEPTEFELRHHWAINALSAWYWLNWALFKDTLGEDGYFMLNAWRALREYLPLATRAYEGVGPW